jgi:hypothetical protein
MVCKEIKCPDYLTDEGEPAWCYRAGQPAEVAVAGCPNGKDGKSMNGNGKKTQERKNEKQHIGS